MFTKCKVNIACHYIDSQALYYNFLNCEVNCAVDKSKKGVTPCKTLPLFPILEARTNTKQQQGKHCTISRSILYAPRTEPREATCES